MFDELIHASVHDGMRQSRAGQCTAFAHNDVGALRRILERIKLDNAGIREGHSNVFVAIEAVYSMDGDVAPLADIVDALDRVLDRGNGHLILDEAHAVGVFGPNGRGLAVQLGLQDRISLRLHTFGKALACSGAVILCSPTIRQYLINYARPCIYSTFMPFPLLTAIRVSHDYLEDGHCSVLVQRLQQLGEILRTGLLEVANSISKPSSHLFRVPEVPSPSAISYVMSSRSLELAEHCRSRGFWVRAILPPTVPSGTDRVRICLHGGNTKEEVQGLIAAIRVWVKREPTAKI